MKLAERIDKIAQSGTMVIAARALQLKADGKEVIDLSVGEPDFPTPQRIKDAARKAIDENKTKYTFNHGILQLRAAISEKLRIENNVNFGSNQIIISNGAKHALLNAAMAIVSSGDEVIIPSPYYVSHPEMVKLAGGTPLFAETNEENGFKVNRKILDKVLTSKTRAVLMCNPVNPTGAAYTKDELDMIAEFVIENDLMIIVDEIYEKLVYDDFRFVSLPSLGNKIKDRTILVNGVSKSYSMTGWRIGYAAGAEKVVRAMNKIQSHSTSNACTISQYAALEAFTGNQDEIELMRTEFESRRDFMCEELARIKDLNVIKPKGAFYLFVNIKSLLGKKLNGQQIDNSHDFSMYLIENANIVTVPGSVFGAEGYIRITYANSMNNLEKAVAKLKKLLNT